eukprot:scaffold1421_cov255-Pinguiococcus_pyrenoidosus.AAC.13
MASSLSFVQRTEASTPKGSNARGFRRDRVVLFEPPDPFMHCTKILSTASQWPSVVRSGGRCFRPLRGRLRSGFHCSGLLQIGPPALRCIVDLAIVPVPPANSFPVVVADLDRPAPKRYRQAQAHEVLPKRHGGNSMEEFIVRSEAIEEGENRVRFTLQELRQETEEGENVIFLLPKRVEEDSVEGPDVAVQHVLPAAPEDLQPDLLPSGHPATLLHVSKHALVGFHNTMHRFPARCRVARRENLLDESVDDAHPKAHIQNLSIGVDGRVLS